MRKRESRVWSLESKVQKADGACTLSLLLPFSLFSLLVSLLIRFRLLAFLVIALAQGWH
jgi:hypothetical protein